MKLKKFKERNHKQFGIIVFTITCILLVAGVVLYRTFAIFEVKTNQNVIKGKVGDMGDIQFAFYQMNDNGNYEIQKDMPSKEEGYRLDTKTSYCGVNGEKDLSITVSMSNDWIVQVKGMTTSRTKCNLYFKKGENFVKYIQQLPTQEEDSGVSGLYLIDHSTANITWKGTDEQVNNLKKEERRYAGVNYTDGSIDYVYNYVNIDGQVWRVIGLVNTPEGQRIKLVKDESIGKSSWDTSASNVNNGYGINEWGKSDLMKLLNFGYDRNELESSDGVIQKNAYVNNSLYWNGKSGQCYSSEKNAVNDCNFTDNKISENLKKMIEEVTWNTGSILASGDSTNTVKKIYEYERSSNIGKICSNSVWCNDKEERTTNWKGEVSLIYASDYGYATSGGTVNKRTECLDSDILISWANDCYMNDWLYSAKDYWTLSPYQHLTLGSIVLNVLMSGYLYKGYNAGRGFDIYPSVYLSSFVLLINGDGSFDNMFVLSL